MAAARFSFEFLCPLKIAVGRESCGRAGRLHRPRWQKSRRIHGWWQNGLTALMYGGGDFSDQGFFHFGNRRPGEERLGPGRWKGDRRIDGHGLVLRLQIEERLVERKAE